MDERLKTPKNRYIRTALKLDTTEEKPMFTERFRGDEQTGLNILYGCFYFLNDGEQKLSRRMDKMGILWRFKGLKKQLEKLIHAVEVTAEPEQRATLALRGLHTSAYIGIPKASHDPHGTYILIDDLNEICRAVIDNTCGFCSKKGKEAHDCPIQKALRACTTLMDNKQIDGCMFKPYSDAGRLGLLDEEEDLIV